MSTAFYWFPYNEVPKGGKIVIYGAGLMGQAFVQQIKENDYCKIVGIFDRNYKNITIPDMAIYAPDKIVDFTYDKIVVAVQGKFRAEVLVKLDALLDGDKSKIVTSYGDDRISKSELTIDAIIIKHIFDKLKIYKPSYFDIGACHPHLSSNTWPFYLSGSRGLNVEPNIDLKKEFDKYRPSDKNLFVGVSAKEEIKTFYVSSNEYISSFIKQDEERNARFSASEKETREVQMYTLNGIAEKFWNGFPDYLDIDIEGLDATVLESCDFSKSSPKVICVEGNIKELNPILMNKVCENGETFMPYCIIPSNIIYLRGDVYRKILDLDK